RKGEPNLGGTLCRRWLGFGTFADLVEEQISEKISRRVLSGDQEMIGMVEHQSRRSLAAQSRKRADRMDAERQDGVPPRVASIGSAGGATLCSFPEVQSTRHGPLGCHRFLRTSARRLPPRRQTRLRDRRLNTLLSAPAAYRSDGRSKANAIQAPPLKISSIPTNRPITQSPETGHCARTRMPSTNVIRPLSACQPQSGSETMNGVISWNRPATRKNAPINKVKTSAVATGRHIISAPTTPNSTAASQWW